MLARQSTPTVYPVGKVSNPYRCLLKKVYFFFLNEKRVVFHLRGMFTRRGGAQTQCSQLISEKSPANACSPYLSYPDGSAQTCTACLQERNSRESKAQWFSRKGRDPRAPP